MSIKKILLIFFTITIMFVVISGCITESSTFSSQLPDPADGVKNFVDAMNQNNATKLYDLYSLEMKDNLSTDPLYNFGIVRSKIVNYTIFDKKVDRNNATVYVRFVFDSQNPYQKQTQRYSSSDVQMFFVFEDNQWKLSENLYPDPEDSVKNFVDAINQKNGTKLLNLASRELEVNKSIDYASYFDQDLQNEPEIVNYTIFEKTINGNRARVNVQFTYEKPISGNALLSHYTSWMAFILEDNQWKMTAL
jgi:hypothetical protein